MLASVLDDLHRAKSCQQRLWLPPAVKPRELNQEKRRPYHLPASATETAEDQASHPPASRKLIAAAKMFHVRLAINPALHDSCPGIRAPAVLPGIAGTYERDRIDYVTPPSPGAQGIGTDCCEHAQVALQEAKLVALSEYVIEWAGQRVKSLKKGLKTARERRHHQGRVTAHPASLSSRAYG